MRRLAIILLLGVMLIVVAGCGGQMKDYVIKFDGTEGATFEGVMMYQIDTAPNSSRFPVLSPWNTQLKQS